jgi:hypothetical protein
MSTMLSRPPCPELSAPDWRGWLVVICSGIGAGVLIGSEIPAMFYWQRPAGQITAGVAVALLTASLAAKRPVLKTLIACVLVVRACLMTITLRAWFGGHWPVGHIDHKWPVIFVPWGLYGCGPGMLVSLIIAAVRRRRAEPGTAPKGGLAAPVDNSRGPEGPP